MKLAHKERRDKELIRILLCIWDEGRGHFISPLREKKLGGLPPMNELRRWMADVMWPVKEEDSEHQSRGGYKSVPFPEPWVVTSFDSDRDTYPTECFHLSSSDATVTHPRNTSKSVAHSPSSLNQFPADVVPSSFHQDAFI